MCDGDLPRTNFTLALPISASRLCKIMWRGLAPHQIGTFVYKFYYKIIVIDIYFKN